MLGEYPYNREHQTDANRKHRTRVQDRRIEGNIADHPVAMFVEYYFIEAAYQIDEEQAVVGVSEIDIADKAVVRDGNQPALAYFALDHKRCALCAKPYLGIVWRGLEMEQGGNHNPPHCRREISCERSVTQTGRGGNGDFEASP